MSSSRTHYVTLSGLPPNGGVPPDVAFQRAPSPPQTPPQQQPPPPYTPAPTQTRPPTPPPFECPGLRFKNKASVFANNGVAYLFPRHHATIHFFNTGARPFEPTPPGGPSSHAPPSPPSSPKPEFLAAHAALNMPLAELMLQLGVPTADEGASRRYGVTECLERGAGRWARGRTWTVEGARPDALRVGDVVGWAALGDEGDEKKEKVLWLAAFDRGKHGEP